MRTHPVATLAVTATTAAIASVLAVSITLAFQHHPTSTEPVFDEAVTIAARDADEADADLRRQLDEISAMIRNMRVERIEAAEPPPARVATAATRSVQTRDVGAPVLAHLTRIATTARGRVHRHLPANWHALTTFRTLGQQSRKQAEREVLLMTIPEIVTRFGFPTQVTPSNEGIVLRYMRKNARTNNKEAVAFYVRSGYVTKFELKDPSRIDITYSTTFQKFITPQVLTNIQWEPFKLSRLVNGKLIPHIDHKKKKKRK